MNTSLRTPATAPRAKRPALPPPFPAVAVQLIQQMQLPAVSAGDVGRLIELDPSLTASLLRLVNSPFFGMRREIGSVSEAVMVMGMGAVRRLVLSLAVAGPLRQSVDPVFAKSQWQCGLPRLAGAKLQRRLRPRADMQLVVNVPQMPPHRAVREAEPVGDLLVGEAGGQ